MPMRITIDLADDDLKHFRLIMRAARNNAQRAHPEDVIEGAESLLREIDPKQVPRFIGDRLTELRRMIDMLVDHEWRLPQRDAARVLNALAYFTDPEDLIPDHVPGIGFLDDAIMIELVVRDLRHELDAYRDFCDFRRQKAAGRGVKAKSSEVTREKWLDDRRKALLERMRRRRKKSKRGIL